MSLLSNSSTSAKEPSGARPNRVSIGRIAVYGSLVLASIYCLAPLYVMLATSLKSTQEVASSTIFALPTHPTFEAWVKAWDSACTGAECEGIKVGFWNSVILTVPSVIIAIVVASINGYSLVNWKFRGGELMFAILIAGSFVPYQVFIYPLVRITSALGIYSTPLAVVFVHTVLSMPLMTLLFRNYYSTLPPELFKAARVDGAGFWTAYFRIMLPMSMPVTGVAIILLSTVIWNDFLVGLVFAGQKYAPMTVQLNNIVNSIQGTREYNVNMAATILTAAVPLSIYVFSGKLFVRGIAAGAVKG